MVDYYALISPTIEPLADATPEERQVVYRRLVDVLDQQLRATDPPRSDKDILKERIELESAIRRIERHILARQKSRAPGMDRPLAPPPQEGTIPTSPLPRMPRTLSPLAVPQVDDDTERQRHEREERQRHEREERQRREREEREREEREREEREREERERIAAQEISPPPSFYAPIDQGSASPSPPPFDTRPPSTTPIARIPDAPSPFEDERINTTPTTPSSRDEDDLITDAPDVPDIPVASRSLFSRNSPLPSKNESDTSPFGKEESQPETPFNIGDVVAVPESAILPIETPSQPPSWMSATSDGQEDMVTPAPRDDSEQRVATPTTGIILTAQKVERIQHKGLILRISIVVLVLMGLLATVGGIAEFLSRNATDPSAAKNSESSPASVTASVKFQDRLPVEPDAQSDLTTKGTPGIKGQDGTDTTTSSNNPIITRAVFIEEPGAGIGEARRTEGRVTWKLETLPSGVNGKADLGVRATVDLTDIGLSATFLFRKNRDTSSSDAYLIEIEFQATGDPANGKIRDISVPEMRGDEKARGASLAGIPVPVSDTVFLVGLNGLQADLTRNLDLIQKQNWFLFQIRYSTGKRAVLLFEKGKTGSRIFEDALQAWK